MYGYLEDRRDILVRKKLILCPKCGYQFDVSYARAFACRGCPSSAMGSCGYIKCPKCGHEFPYPTY